MPQSFSKKEKEYLQGNAFYYTQGEDTRTLGGDWYRGEHLNFWPSKVNLAEPNGLYDYFLKGLVPNDPFINKTDFITTFGSCFAVHIRKYLKNLGYTIHEPKTRYLPIIHVSEGLNNTFSLLEQFQWAWENKSIDNELWIDADKKAFSVTEESRLETKEILDKTDVFILTLGLSEVWYNKHTNAIFWRGVPINKFDPSQHGFRLSTVKENTDNLFYIYKMIRKYRPNSKIIFTLSPVPLIATFRPIPCTSASSVSKAILRVALDTLCSYAKEESPGHVFYWPSYEIIKEYKNLYELDNRHIDMAAVETILSVFKDCYLKG